METGRLFGTDTAGGSTGGGTGAVSACRWSAEATGKVQKIRVYAAQNGNFKVGVYTGDSYPATRIGVQNTGVACTGGQWNDVSLEAECDVTKDTLYWILLLPSAAYPAFHYYSDTARPYKYRIRAYADGLPATFDSSWTDFSGYAFSAAAYGILVISPSGIAQPVSCGAPEVLLAPIQPSSIVQQVAVGTPVVLNGLLMVQPSSIVQQIPVGSPTLLKALWHLILAGLYSTETPDINRAYVIGRDINGNPVCGTAIDSDEVSLVGERLDFIQELAIPTEARAQEVAEAVLAKMGLTGKRGVILIPPNCGQELFDVVAVTDSRANQQAVKYRVVGIRFEYNPRQARYFQKLILGAP
jgi:hypothetical protein